MCNHYNCNHYQPKLGAYVTHITDLFPDKTPQATRSPFSIASATSSESGPLFPIHVMHPYPTRLNPSCSRKGITPPSLK